MIGRMGLSAMAGVTDSSFVNGVEGIGFACIGGFSLDGPTMEASRRMANRGREEFTGFGLEDVVSEAVNCDAPCLVNVRTASLDPLIELAEAGPSIEINAHCRQQEMLEAGSGESLLRRPEVLSGWIEEVKSIGGTVGVKTRANVVDDGELAASMEPHFFHVDAMDSGGYDLSAVRETRENFDGVLIGNNSVRTPSDVRAMLDAGADLVSAARPARRDPAFFVRLASEIEGYPGVDTRG